MNSDGEKLEFKIGDVCVYYEDRRFRPRFAKVVSFTKSGAPRLAYLEETIERQSDPKLIDTDYILKPELDHILSGELVPRKSKDGVYRLFGCGIMNYNPDEVYTYTSYG